MAGDMFQGIPDAEPEVPPEWSAWLGGIAVLAVFSLFGALLFFTPKTVNWTVSGGILSIATTTGHARFLVRELALSDARSVDFQTESALRPGGKIRGFNGFGFMAGRFRLANGQDVELYLAKEPRALLIPRRGKVPLMVGSSRPEALLRALEGAAP